MKTRFTAVVIVLMAIAIASFAQAKDHRSRVSHRPPYSQTYHPERHAPHHQNHKPRISSYEIKRVQEFYWIKYRLRLSRSEAERIIIADRRNRMNPYPPVPPSPKH